MNDIGDMLVDANNEGYKEGYQQGRADAIEDFIKEHTSLNFRGEPYIFITNTEYEQLKEQTK